MKKIVYDTNGVEWVIKRHWEPRKLNFKFLKKFTRYKNSNKDSLKNFAEIGFVDDIVGIVISLLIVILLYFILVPLLLIFLDLIIIILLTIIGIAFRILFRRPWEISAKSSQGMLIEKDAIGYRNSREIFHELANDLEAGRI